MLDRRRFVSTAAMFAAAAELGIAHHGSGTAAHHRDRHLVSSAEADRCRRRSSIGYAEAGPADGTPVILLHGWPYDIHSYVDVAPLLARPGYRVIVPYLRGYGTTRFLSERDVRERPAGGAGGRRHRAHGCAEDREGDRRRLRLGRAHRQHRRGALAGALQGPGLGQRLPDRQPGGQQEAAAAEGRAAVVVPVLLRDRARPRRLREIPARLRQADLADSPRRNGSSTTPRSSAAPRPSTIRTTSTS